MSDRREDPARLPELDEDEAAWPAAGWDAEPEPEAAPDTEPEPEPDPEAAPDTEPEPEAEAAPDTEPDTEPEAEAAPDTEPEPDTEPDAEPESEAAPDPTTAVGPEAPFVLRLAPEPEPEPSDPPLGGRPMALRLARLHLRMGVLAQARAELEALAGRGALDEEALVDLAEIRWRTGDLAGAGEAANAAISRGRTDGVALVIAAEAVAALGRPSEARRLAARALGTIEAPLDPIFAGMPRSAVWPGDHMLDAGPPDPAIDRARAVAGGAAVAASAAAEAFAGGRAAMNRGDSTTAAIRLGISLRLDPGFARGVLDVVEDRTEAPLLALVAGDALRLLGREDEALEAYHQARGRVTTTARRLDEVDGLP